MDHTAFLPVAIDPNPAADHLLELLLQIAVLALALARSAQGGLRPLLRGLDWLLLAPRIWLWLRWLLGTLVLLFIVPVAGLLVVRLLVLLRQRFGNLAQQFSRLLLIGQGPGQV
jgi:hypothetical protein